MLANELYGYWGSVTIDNCPDNNLSLEWFVYSNGILPPTVATNYSHQSKVTLPPNLRSRHPDTCANNQAVYEADNGDNGIGCVSDNIDDFVANLSITLK